MNLSHSLFRRRGPFSQKDTGVKMPCRYYFLGKKVKKPKRQSGKTKQRTTKAILDNASRLGIHAQLQTGRFTPLSRIFFPLWAFFGWHFFGGHIFWDHFCAMFGQKNAESIQKNAIQKIIQKSVQKSVRPKFFYSLTHCLIFRLL